MAGVTTHAADGAPVVYCHCCNYYSTFKCFHAVVVFHIQWCSESQGHLFVSACMSIALLSKSDF